jgi:uridine phosphorylase
MVQVKGSDLILNSDGSVFHLHLKPGEIADKIILVGDPGRVMQVSDKFSSIRVKVANREFISHTGIYNGSEISVISTGIGTDNIDIVLNELDALVNIDLEKRVPRSQKRSLTIIRIGTSGALQMDIPVGTFLISKKAIGFDGLLNYYKGLENISEADFEEAITTVLPWNKKFARPYVIRADKKLLQIFKGANTTEGFTISAPGFYAPQGRSLRLAINFPDWNNSIEKFSFNNQKITNFEMESSAIYGLSTLMGHKALTICAIIANRISQEYIADYKSVMNDLILYTLDKLSKWETMTK